MSDPMQNRFLTVRKDVVRTECTDPVLVALDPEFEKLPAQVSSIYRSPQEQLNLIRYYARVVGIADQYPIGMNCGLVDKNDDGTYQWQLLWSELLHREVIINPPLAAVVLKSYMHHGVDKKGEMIEPSLHSLKLAIDISGKYDNPNGSSRIILPDVIQLVSRLDLEKYGVHSFVVEHNNDCVHLNCIKCDQYVS